MKPYHWLLGFILSLFIIGLALGQTYPTNIRYQSVKEFPSLQEKIGSVLGIAPFKDDRPDKPYVGHQASFRRVSNYFKSEPFPLEEAISDSFSKAISRSGVKTIPIHNWDRKAESLKNVEADSILMIEIKRFWTEGITTGRGTKVVTSIYLVIHLGVKKEGKVFTKNVYVMKERTIPVLTPDEVEQILNRNLARTFDDFLSNPY